jgi:hypothetical protein
MEELDKASEVVVAVGVGGVVPPPPEQPDTQPAIANRVTVAISET